MVDQQNYCIQKTGLYHFAVIGNHGGTAAQGFHRGTLITTFHYKSLKILAAIQHKKQTRVAPCPCAPVVQIWCRQ
jgi:hypothetical protein